MSNVISLAAVRAARQEAFAKHAAERDSNLAACVAIAQPHSRAGARAGAAPSPKPCPTPPVAPPAAPPLHWRESQRGNPYATTERYHVVVYPTGGSWGYRITERVANQGAYGPGRFTSRDEAMAAAEVALTDLESRGRGATSLNQPNL
jgi:hypothetical protein